jgi:glycerol-3-phosphate acyltransferase PlsY
MAIIGHCYPVWLKFKGGKGVATVLGLLLALSFPVGLACCATWLAMAALKRISSLAALTAVVSSTAWMILLSYPEGITLSIILMLFVYYRHLDNVARMKAGTEPKIGA